MVTPVVTKLREFGIIFIHDILCSPLYRTAYQIVTKNNGTACHRDRRYEYCKTCHIDTIPIFSPKLSNVMFPQKHRYFLNTGHAKTQHNTDLDALFG